jgi:hypothetical protein
MHTFKCNKLILSSISLIGGLVSTSLWADNVSAKEEWKFTLKMPTSIAILRMKH